MTGSPENNEIEKSLEDNSAQKNNRIYRTNQFRTGPTITGTTSLTSTVKR